MANRLQELRLEHGEKQADLAKLLGRTEANYCKMELGYIKVTLEHAHKLAVHWGVSIEQIFFAEENSQKENASGASPP